MQAHTDDCRALDNAALENAIRRFLETAATNGCEQQVEASMIGPSSNAEATCRNPDKHNTLGDLAGQAGSTSLTILRRLAPYGLQMAVSAATYSMGLGLFQVLGYGLRVSCSTPFVSSCLGCLGVGVSSAVSAHLTRHVQRQLDLDGPLALLRAPPWAGFDPDEALMDAVLGLTVFKVCSGQFRRVMPSDLTQPGAWAIHSLPISGSSAVTGDKYAVGEGRALLHSVLNKHGCHHCGSKTGKLVGDHMPPTALFKQALGDKAPTVVSEQPMLHQVLAQVRNWLVGNPYSQRQRLFPQCADCSGKQALYLRHGKSSPLVLHWRLWRLTPPGFLPGVLASLRPVDGPVGPSSGRPGPHPRSSVPTKARHTNSTHWASKSWWQSSLIVPSHAAAGAVLAMHGSHAATPLALSPRHMPAAQAAVVWGAEVTARHGLPPEEHETGYGTQAGGSTGGILAWTQPVDESWRSPGHQSGVGHSHTHVWATHTAAHTQPSGAAETHAHPTVTSSTASHLSYTPYPPLHLAPLHIGGHHIHTDVVGQGAWWDSHSGSVLQASHSGTTLQGSCEVTPESPQSAESPRASWAAAHPPAPPHLPGTHASLVAAPAPQLSMAAQRTAWEAQQTQQPWFTAGSSDVPVPRSTHHTRLRVQVGPGAAAHGPPSAGPRSHAVSGLTVSLKRHRYTSSEAGDDMQSGGQQVHGSGDVRDDIAPRGSVGASLGSDQSTLAVTPAGNSGKVVPNGMIGRMVQGLGRGFDQALSVAVRGVGPDGAVHSPPAGYVQALHI